MTEKTEGSAAEKTEEAPWWSEGYEEGAKIAQGDKKRREKAKVGRRFKLPPEPGDDPENIRNEADVIIVGGVAHAESGDLTGNPFCMREHNPYLEGGWKHTFTCMRRTPRGCPFCDKGIKNYYAGFFTIIDCRSWTDDERNVHHMERKLLVVKSDQLPMFKTFDTQLEGGIVGQQFHVTRTGDRKYAIGDVWVPTKKVALAELENSKGERVDTTLIPYRKILAPLSHDEAVAAIAGYTPQNEGRGGGGGGGGGGGYGKDKVVKY